MKPNEGEVPQYYVEHSHAHIIEPDEWDHVQVEFARRRALGGSYSGKSSLSAKLVCEDCGSFYGSKVWHSSDKYRRTIWHCNSKFGNQEKCSTPTLLQQTFIIAYNRLMSNRKQILEDCELMRRSLTDFDALDARIEQLDEEAKMVEELVRAVVKENASTAQSQEAYLKRYETLTQRYEAVTGGSGAAAKGADFPQPAGQVHGPVHSHLQEAARSPHRLGRCRLDDDGGESHCSPGWGNYLCVLQRNRDCGGKQSSIRHRRKEAHQRMLPGGLWLWG